MKKERFERGLENLKKVDGDAGLPVIHSLEDIAPDLGTYIIEFAFGDIYDRKGLSLKQREMITITSLLSQGGLEPQLEVHIRGALNVGLSKEEIVEIIIHCVPYVGFPKVLNAINVAKKVFNEA